jgi:condensin complex subunit 1
MDVDEEGGGEAGGDTEEDEPSRMSVDDDEGNDSIPKKAPKLKPRKSQLNVEALTQEQAILATYNEAELTELRLKKKYYSDALNFIDGIESAMDPMCKLLGSTSKPEVLEVMEFLRVAHEYEFESAKVRLFPL